MFFTKVAIINIIRIISFFLKAQGFGTHFLYYVQIIYLCKGIRYIKCIDFIENRAEDDRFSAKML